MVADVSYDRLLANLYASVTAKDRLPAFLHGLNVASGSHLTMLVGHDLQNPAGNVYCTPGMDLGVDEALVARYQADFSGVDDKLWFQRSARLMAAGVVLDGEQLATKAEVKRTRYYTEILRKVDIMHSVGICGFVTPRRSLFLAPCRSERAGPYEPDQVRFLRQIGQHWANACALGERFRELEESCVTGRRRRGVGLFLLDHDMRWVGGNEAAEGMVSGGWWRASRGTRLVCASAATHAQWREAQRRIGNLAEAASRTIPVYDAVGSLVAFACLQSYGACSDASGLAAFALFVRPLGGADDAALADELQFLFALTPAEARFAVTLRRHGELGRAAATAGVTGRSARVRLQAIFDKTGMHRQGELMRMLDALATALEDS